MTDTNTTDRYDAAKKVFETFKKFVGPSQLKAIGSICSGEERDFMFDKIAEYGNRIEIMPKTYEQDGKGDEAIAYLHYFKGNMDWYITEKDMEAEQFQAFGLADFGYGEPELGYINIEELKENNIELDLHFKPQTLGKVKEFLKSIGKLVIAATLATSLSACADTTWVKPNTTPTDWQRDKAECLMEGMKRVPVNPVYTMQAGSTYSTENCDKKGRNCSVYSSFTPPSIEEIDANAPLREQVVKSCLYRKGWTEAAP